MAARGFRHGDFALSTSSYDGIYEFEPCATGSRRELLWRMLIGSIPGVLIGAHFSDRAPEKLLRPMIALVLAAVGGKLLAT